MIQMRGHHIQQSISHNLLCLLVRTFSLEAIVVLLTANTLGYIIEGKLLAGARCKLDNEVCWTQILQSDLVTKRRE